MGQSSEAVKSSALVIAHNKTLAAQPTTNSRISFPTMARRIIRERGTTLHQPEAYGSLTLTFTSRKKQNHRTTTLDKLRMSGHEVAFRAPE